MSRSVQIDPASYLHPKQLDCFRLLMDRTTRFLTYGGSVAGGKSFLASFYLIHQCMRYAGSRWILGRKELDKLKKSTLVTFYKVLADLGIRDLVTFNGHENTLTFANGSVVLLMALDTPAGTDDASYLGSIEVCGAVIDEANETTEGLFVTLIQRLRWRLKDFDITGKILICSNPTKGWLKRRFYDRWRDGVLPVDHAYVPCLPEENPHNEKSYLDSLTIENLGESAYFSKARGLWDYESDSNALVAETDVANAFNWSLDTVDQRGRYLTVDPAYGGDDRSVVMYWQGLHLVRTWIWKKKDPLEQIAEIKRIISEYHIPIDHVAFDGISSAALVAHFRGCVDFRANAKTIPSEAPYKSLKDQLYFKLAEELKKGTLRFSCPEIQDQLTQEITAHKMVPDKDDKRSVLPKPTVKAMIGRSPDLSDCVMMRMFWTLRNTEFRMDVFEFGQRRA